VEQELGSILILAAPESWIEVLPLILAAPESWIEVLPLILAAPVLLSQLPTAAARQASIEALERRSGSTPARHGIRS
jgi:hypothetical protein